MPRDFRLLLNDVLEYSSLAERLSAGKTYLAYANDERLRLALERCLSNIGEALVQSSAQRRDLGLYVADLQKIIGFRHRLVHGYYSIADQVCWSIVIDRLPDLTVEITNFLEDGFAGSEEDPIDE